jgi:hypothetical protein
VPARGTLLLALVGALALAGCGPPKAHKAGVYTLSATKKCLEQAGSRVATGAAPGDFVSDSAPNGALRSSRDAKGFTIAFGNTREDSDLLVRGYRRAASTPLERKRLGSLLDLEGNAVVYWQTEPTAAEKDFVRGCLQ